LKNSGLSYILIILLSGCLLPLQGQISPGELTTSHADLEGISNCTKCHTLGDKVSNEKCLECHTILKARIDAAKGFHVSADVRGQDCFKCHSEHHGRHFEMIRFDVDNFDHTKTGYTLAGAHDKLDCAECHKPDFIADKKIREISGTYLGLGTACLTCHDDYHQNTLSKDCAGCHNADAFTPATLFVHDKTDFPLRGAHRDVDCASCHAVTETEGKNFQEFGGIAFSNCSSCHDDVHNGRFGTNCKECHVEESFRTFRGMGSFNHNKTKFPLLGKHSSVSCSDCHDTHVSTAEMFKDFTHRDVSNCVSCHEDVHAQKFGIDCKSCHSEQSFQTIKNMDAFNHGLTDYALEGKHLEVDCRSCHEAKMTDPLPHTRCVDCHDDYHEGQFVSVSGPTDCAECHSVQGFPGSSFTVEQHNAGNFALTGGHLATPCFACHLTDDKWVFRDIGTRCNTCHEDAHHGTIDERYYPDKACESCHNTAAWQTVVFDHAQTGFALEEAHARATCTACHIPDTTLTATSQFVFSELSTTCADCHADVHRAQFETEGETDCTRCHGFGHWKPSSFDHNSARFVLEGAHLEVACGECHKETAGSDGPFTVYRLEKMACVDCHL